MAMLLRRPRFKLIFIPTVLFAVVALHYIIQNQYQIRNTLSYATRPIWDAASGPKEIIPHYYAEGMNMNVLTCKLHGWKEREGKDQIKVMDSVLMSSELDLLEIRMNELDSVVDNFFIIESNTTFTGLPKDTYFANNRERFAKFEQKIVYQLLVRPRHYDHLTNKMSSLPGYPLRSGQSAWDVEAHTRDSMTRLLRSHIRDLPADKTLVLMSDIDEIPSSHTVELLKACDFGTSIHLQLRNFLYRCVFCIPILVQLLKRSPVLNGTWTFPAGVRACTFGASIRRTGIPRVATVS
jgi:beta-1,4-mannosyl-glycoprotein beta-1,4-N-acetylglucosaminyltransferase